MTLTGYITGWAIDYRNGLEYAAEQGIDAIEEYFFDNDVECSFLVDKAGNFFGALVQLALSPRIEFNSATGVIRARDASIKQVTVAGARLSDAAREELQNYFADIFELARACGDV